MNWTTEVPKESGIYWAKLSLELYQYYDEIVKDESTTPVFYNSETDGIHILGYEEWYGPESIGLWGDKLGIPE